MLYWQVLVQMERMDRPTRREPSWTARLLIDLQHGSAVEALQQHDAYTYFSQEKDGPLIMTGPTGTNVADVCVTLVR